MITTQQKQFFDEQGYLICKELFSQDEIHQYLHHYMEMHHIERARAVEGITNPGDPLVQFPRLMMMHRKDALSLKWLLDIRIAQTLTSLLGSEPYAVQTMMYFKPPQARGQALHQDQYYLRVNPGTCIAAWMALDRCDEENGCLKVVPGSQNWPLLCTTKADTQQSFTDVTVPIPQGTPVVPVILDPGDVLFFNGQVVHGSGPNFSKDRFRRSLIGHYIAGDAREVWKWYRPALRMDGSEVDLDLSQNGGTCGTWVDMEGNPVIEISGDEALATRRE
jgi:phytanoyl-CoA hydroxylase